jgi:ATP-dependent DNA helicase DinG
MKPTDFQLPFPAYRAGQLEWALEAAHSPERFALMVLPTGAGKSLTYMTAARIYMGDRENARVVVLTSSRGLQDQLQHDFDGLADVRGMANYPCLEVGGVCADAPCVQGESCMRRDNDCLYFDAVKRAAAARMVSTNYSFYLHSLRQRSIGRFDLIIADEAHDLEEWVRGHWSVDVKPEELEWAAGVVGKALPRWSQDLRAWKSWASEVVGLAAASPMPRTMLPLIEELRKLGAVKGEAGWWCEAEEERGLRATPLDLKPFIAQVFSGAGKVILSSATLTPKMVEDWGVGEEEMVVIEADSPFPIASRPIYMMDGAPRVNHRATEAELLVWARKIDLVIGARPGRRGIVHTVSYQRANYLAQRSDHRGRIIVAGNGRGTKQAVEEYRRRAGAVMLSPALGTGWDFPGDQCRFQVLGKVPYPDSRDPREKAIFGASPNLASRMAATQIVQCYGRGVRGRGDWCETFLCDGNFGWFLRTYRDLLPKWFRGAVSRRQSIPAPIGG